MASMEPAPTEPEQPWRAPSSPKPRERLNGAGSDGAGTASRGVRIPGWPRPASMEPAPTEPEQSATAEPPTARSKCLNGAGSDGAGTGVKPFTAATTPTGLNGAGSDGAGTAAPPAP